ncbi:MAG: hypothetical protein K0S47_4667 [Herbinix sp.]|jgi:hypothetical protein|nr:hypothetical protein [Herbinix sp.]
MKKWFFTFSKGAIFQDYFVEVFAPTYLKARDTMCCYYGKGWSKQYSREEWFKPLFTVAGEYHLKYLETLIYSEEVENYLIKYNELIKKYK